MFYFQNLTPASGKSRLIWLLSTISASNATRWRVLYDTVFVLNLTFVTVIGLMGVRTYESLTK